MPLRLAETAQPAQPAQPARPAQPAQQARPVRPVRPVRPARPTRTVRRLGLWMEAEGDNRPFLDKKSLDIALEFTGQGGLTDLYCQVYRGGRAWFPSMMADDQPYRDALKGGVDPLAEIIRQSHKRGQKVHAWVNVLRAWHNHQAPILQVIGEDAVLRDNYGYSLLEYDEEGVPPGTVGKHYKLGTPGVWLNASSAKVRSYIVATLKELVLAYPKLDGIHLDMVRFPFAIPVGKKTGFFKKPRYGYSPNLVNAFNNRKGTLLPDLALVKMEKGKYVAKPSGEQWDEWRRAQITLLVLEIREMLARIAPRMELSAAVVAWVDRARDNAFQAWPEWVNAGLVDRVVPMAYTRDRKVVKQLGNRAVRLAGPERTFIGLGAWLMLNDSRLAYDQTKEAFGSGASGVVLFSYSNLLSRRGRSLVRQVSQAVGGR